MRGTGKPHGRTVIKSEDTNPSLAIVALQINDGSCYTGDSPLEACNLTAETVKLVVPHQVNQRIIDSATEKMGFPKEKVFINIDKYGNTSAASVPIALDEAHQAKRYAEGDWVIMVGFGAGLTWAGATFRM